MSKKNDRNTQGRIISAAWDLFYEQGYEDTTIEDIIERSETSKGSFYHYFTGKDDLLGTLAYLFDSKYEELQGTLDPAMPAFDKLLYLNHELFRMIENKVSLDLLTRLISTQLVTHSEKQLLDRNRLYYRLLRKIIGDGLDRGELDNLYSANEMVKTYALCERALLYDWCLCAGEYSLADYGDKMMPLFLAHIRNKS